MSDLHILSLASVIELNDVEFCWPNSPQSALNIKQLSVKRGEHLFIKGPSGCGKSTLLSLLTGINQAQHGRVSILGTDLSALTSRQ
ncbi:hypothetical protein VAE308_970231 [Vibrio aestuarianus]|nr:hypothetical protein VAE063_880234 [Vibrio aestuarianus]CAH8237598.1 hypothetical protein VAE308_970231 [Vibrio aestuarianus]